MTNALLHHGHRAARPSSGVLLRLVRCVVGGVLLLFPPAVRAQSASAKEYQLKAVFLFNFAQFVDWPPDAFATPQSPLVIGIIGDDPFGGYLDELVKGEKVNDHPLVVQRYRDASETTNCHILFVGVSESKRWTGIFDALKASSVLTVGDMEGFAKQGGMIRFATQNGKMRFRICVETAKAARLTISSKLLRSAQIVTPGKD